MLRLVFDPEAANKIPDVAVYRDLHDKVCQIFAIHEFNSFVSFLDDGYDITLAEIYARNFSKSPEEYDYLEGVALRALGPVKSHCSTIFDSYLWGCTKMSPPQRDFRQEQIVRSFNNFMKNVSADLAHITLGLRDKPIPRPPKNGDEKKPPAIIGRDFETKSLLVPNAVDRLKGEDDQMLIASMVAVQELFHESIFDQSSYLSFLDGDLVVDLAHEFADHESVDRASFKKLDKIATQYLEQIRIKHNDKFLVDQYSCDDHEAFVKSSIDFLKSDLRAIAVELAVLAHAIEDKSPNERPHWGPDKAF